MFLRALFPSIYASPRTMVSYFFRSPCESFAPSSHLPTLKLSCFFFFGRFFFFFFPKRIGPLSNAFFLPEHAFSSCPSGSQSEHLLTPKAPTLSVLGDADPFLPPGIPWATRNPSRVLRSLPPISRPATFPTKGRFSREAPVVRGASRN